MSIKSHSILLQLHVHAHNTNPAPTTTPTSATPAPTSPPIPPTLTRPIALAALLVWLAPALLAPLVLLIAVALLRRLDTLLAPAEAALESELNTLESAEVAEDSAEEAPLATLVAALVAALETEDASVEAALETELAPETAAHSCDWRARAAVSSSDEQVDCRHERDACWRAVFVHRQFTSVTVQPCCAAAAEMQVMMQAEMPEVEVGGALEVASWALTPARAATTARAERLLIIIFGICRE